MAIGGGTVTDLVGFVASIYLRGVPFVSCPTTTLAMCDAALGGKNGVDHCGLKNRLGTIRQPELIVIDSAVGAIDGWDSFTHLQALLALEDEFGIQFDDGEEIPDLTSVAKIVHELEARGVSF